MLSVFCDSLTIASLKKKKLSTFAMMVTDNMSMFHIFRQQKQNIEGLEIC